MSIKRMVPNAWHIKEFYGGFNGTCTQTSAAMCLAAALGAPTDHDGVVNLMLDMTHAMIATGTASANGAATVAGMAAELRAKGGNVATEWDYAGDVMPHDWHALLLANAGINPILLQLANAQGLSNAAGTREDGGVHYHAIAVMGIADEGYVIGDPNNPTVEQTFDIYPYAALQAAQPCGLIMLQVKGATPMSQVPAGWVDDEVNKVLTAPNGGKVSGGFRENVLTGWDAASVPMTGEEVFGDIRRQRFAFDVLYADVGKHTIWRGDLREDLKDRMTDLLTLRQQLDAANARLAEPATQIVDTTAVNLKAALTAFLA